MENIELNSCLGSAFISIVWIKGISIFPYLSFISTKPYLLFLALYVDSIEGVAEPKIILVLKILDKYIAESLALYLGEGSCCLYETSCSSSTIIRPRSSNGRKTDDLAPITNCEFSLLLHTLSQTSVLSFREYLEW